MRGSLARGLARVNLTGAGQTQRNSNTERRFFLILNILEISLEVWGRGERGRSSWSWLDFKVDGGFYRLGFDEWGKGS